MKALLLAAGMGTRLRPLTNTLPKCLVPIGGRPLLDYWLDLLGPEPSVDEIIINTHHLPESVRSHIAKSPYQDKIILVHEEVLLGTGGTLIANLHRLLGQEVLLAHADNLTLFSLIEFRAAFEQRPPECVATMMTFLTDSPTRCGIVELDERGVMLRIHEKVPNPPGNLANAAVFLFGPSALEVIAKIRPSILLDISADLVPQLAGRLNTWENVRYHRDIGTPESLAQAEADCSSVFQRIVHKL
jgi:mannose-1-phosphate guanylyltransferase